VRIGVGVSTAREARQAAVGATEHARDELAGEVPSLAVLLASRSHTDEARDVLEAVQETIEPPALIGCVAQAIVAGRRELEDEAGVAVWLASGLSAETFQLDFVRTGSGGLLAGYQFDRSAHDLHLLLPDPYTFPSSLLIEHLNTDVPGTTLMGGVVSGGLGPGDTRLFRDREVLTSGVVGVRLRGMRGVPIVSQGCRPIGEPYIVTGAVGAVITEMGGRSPLQRLREIVETLPPGEQDLVSHGLQIGIVVDEHLALPGQGDFMIRGLLGADASTGATKSDKSSRSARPQFQVRDAPGADRTCAWPWSGRRSTAQPPAGACCSPATGGRRMFGSPTTTRRRSRNCSATFHSPVSSPLGRRSDRGRNALHAFTASMALFVEDNEEAANERFTSASMPRSNAKMPQDRAPPIPPNSERQATGRPTIHSDATRTKEERWQLRPISQRRNGTRCRRAYPARE
jgi:small ligand-binding sensory domain FIST